jgi:hypothetical protein
MVLFAWITCKAQFTWSINTSWYKKIQGQENPEQIKKSTSYTLQNEKKRKEKGGKDRK